MWIRSYIPEADKELEKLDGSIRKRVLAGIRKVAKNPLAYGKPLGNKNGNNLTGFFKVKYKNIGIRVVYTLILDKKIMNIIVISERDDDYCYKVAGKRKRKYGKRLYKESFKKNCK